MGDKENGIAITEKIGANAVSGALGQTLVEPPAPSFTVTPSDSAARGTGKQGIPRL